MFYRTQTQSTVITNHNQAATCQHLPGECILMTSSGFTRSNIGQENCFMVDSRSIKETEVIQVSSSFPTSLFLMLSLWFCSEPTLTLPAVYLQVEKKFCEFSIKLVSLPRAVYRTGKQLFVWLLFFNDKN